MVSMNELAKNVALEAINTILVDGKTISEWIEQLKAVRWISVKDRLPEPDTKVLVYGRNEYGVYCITCHYSAHRKWLYHNRTTADGKTITHWMPLPEPPKEDNHA